MFVYGTLLAGEPNHALLSRARHAGAARTRPEFELVDLGAFPAMVAGGATAVVGEVYEVDAGTLAALDRLEGHPEFYRREPVDLEGGERALTYLLDAAQAAGAPRIASGDWRAHRAARRAR